MAGINNGAYQKLIEEIPSLVHIRCVCHFAISSVTSNLSLFAKNLEFLVSETYKWFARSSSRQKACWNLCQLINDGYNRHKIVQACQTRCLSVASAVKVICDQWIELKTHFEIARCKSCFTSEMLYSIYCDGFNYAYCLKSVLTETHRVNKNVEANDWSFRNDRRSDIVDQNTSEQNNTTYQGPSLWPIHLQSTRISGHVNQPWLWSR